MPEAESLPEPGTDIFRKPRQLYRARFTRDVPKGAIMLTESSVVELMSKRVDLYPNKYKIFPLVYSNYITSSSAVLSAAFITTHYRKVFKLRNYGLITTYGVSCILAGVTSAVLHSEIILKQIYSGYSDCPICLATRSGLFNILSNVVYPMIVAPVMCSLAAKTYSTYYIPAITSTKEAFKLFKTTLPFSLTLNVLLFASFGIGMYLCEKEMETYENVFGRTFDHVKEKPEVFTDI